MLNPEMVKSIVGHMVTFASYFHLPLLIFSFVLGISLRLLIYYTVKRQEWFAREFEKRVGRHLDTDVQRPLSFYLEAKRILEKTYYEIFETRAKLRRRKPDSVMHMSDRVFLIRQGSAWLVHDILKQIKHLRWGDSQPKILNITKNTFQKNPCFNNVFGIVPISGTNDLLNLLPGLFVIGGIFGTFLGVMRGLPELGGMDMGDVEKTRTIMDGFLNEIAFSMTASLVGILFSVVMTVINAIFSPERLFVEVVDRFENSLDLLWHRADNNDIPAGTIDFNEHRDTLEALAEQTLTLDIENTKRTRDMDTSTSKNDIKSA